MGEQNTAPGTGRVRIRRRPGGLWSARFKADTGRIEVSLGVKTKTRAERMARNIDRLLEAGQPWEPAIGRQVPGERTFGVLADEWWASGCRWGETRRKLSASVVHHLVAEFGGRALSDISTKELQAYLARRTADGLKPASIHQYLAVMRVILATGVEWGYLPESPAKSIKGPRIDKKLPAPYRPDEIERLLAVLEPRHQDIVVVYTQTGMRRGEAMGLKWADVDLQGNTLTLRDTKGGRDRAIPLTAAVAAILRRLRHERSQAAVVGLGGLVLGNLADIRQVVVRAWKRAGIEPERQAGLQPLHSFRDTFITQLADSGVALERIQVLAGHQDLNLTRAYTFVRESSLREAMSSAFQAGPLR